MSKAMARSGDIRVWERGVSSSGLGSSSSHLVNQLDLESSSLILSFFLLFPKLPPKDQILWERKREEFGNSLSR